MSEKFQVFLDSRFKKTLNSSYKCNPEKWDLPDYGATFNYFAHDKQINLPLSQNHLLCLLLLFLYHSWLKLPKRVVLDEAFICLSYE